jgi:hypothetical protein
MSYIKQHTEFLSQDWQQCEDWAMMLAYSTNPKREGKTKETKKKEKKKIRKKKKERNKKRGRNTRETTHNTFRA